MGFLAGLQWHAAASSLMRSLTSVLQVELYADYAPGHLMAFLVSSQWYGLEGALQVCEQRGLVREQVFILGRMGSASQALHLIIQRLADIPQVLHATSCRINSIKQGQERAMLLIYTKSCTQPPPHQAPSSKAKKEP